MAALMPEGKQSFQNAAGAPLVAGRLYTYDAGTNTPRQTFADAAGTTPNANPVILDARGEATIFWGGTYKVVLKDAADVTIWTVDNVSGADVLDTALRADLANAASAAKGAGQIGFSYSLAYGANTVGKRLVDAPLYITDFPGADPTGATDSNAAVQAAVARAKTTNKKLIFTTGTFKFSAPITIDWNYANIAFEGKVILQYTGAGNAVVIDGGASGLLYAVQFGADNPPNIRADAATNAVYARSAHHCHIRANVLSAVTSGLLVNFSVCSKFGIVCSSNDQGGAWVGTRPTNGMTLNKRNAGEGVADCVFDNCIIENVNGLGVDGDYIFHCTFLGGTSEGNVGGGYRETGGSGWNVLLNFDCESNGGADFTMAGDSTRVLSGVASSTTTAASITGSRNVIEDGTWTKLTIGGTAYGTVLRGAGLFAPTAPSGAFTDNGIATVYENVKWLTPNGSVSAADQARKPRRKSLGRLTVTAATAANPGVITLLAPGTFHGDAFEFDFNDSLTFNGLAGGTWNTLNGTSVRLEPIGDTNQYRLMNATGTAYLDTSALGAYTASSGTAFNVDLVNSWIPAAGTFRDPGYRKDASGLVKMFGAIKGGATGSSAICTLPAGHRPTGTLIFACESQNGGGTATVYVSVSSAGVVTPSMTLAGGDIVGLDSIQFIAEQ